MFTMAHLHSAAASTSLTGTSASSSGGPSLIVIVVIAIGIVWFLTWLTAGQTVVVVEQSSHFFGFLTILVIAGFVLFMIGTTSGLT